MKIHRYIDTGVSTVMNLRTLAFVPAFFLILFTAPCVMISQYYQFDYVVLDRSAGESQSPGYSMDESVSLVHPAGESQSIDYTLGDITEEDPATARVTTWMFY